MFAQVSSDILIKEKIQFTDVFIVKVLVLSKWFYLFYFRNVEILLDIFIRFLHLIFVKMNVY